MLELIAGLGVGLFLGGAYTYERFVKPLTQVLVQLKYAGFRPEQLPERPKTVPLPPMPRED